MNNRWRKFLSYYRPYTRRFALVLVCALIAAAAALVFPLCVRYVTDAVVAGSATGRLLGLTALVMLAVVAVEFAANFYFDYFGHCVGADMENDLRQELFGHLEKLSFSFYDTNRVGSLMSNLTNDLLNLSELYHHGPEDYLVNFVKFVGASVILFAIDWHLALCLFLFLPVMAFLTLKLNRRVRRGADVNQARIAEINARAEDALSGIRVSQAFCREEHEKKLFAQAGAAFSRSRKDIYLAESVEYQTLTVLTRLMYVAVIIYGGLEMLRGRTDVADLVAFIMYISYLTEPVRHLAWMTTKFQQGLAGFDRVAAVLATEPAVADAPDAVDIGVSQGSVALENVTFRYGEDRAAVLKNVSIGISPGECVAIAGVSGAGKTTLCALIPRFYEPESGRITVDGRDIRDIALRSLRSNISMVQQDTFLFTGSVMENIRYADPTADDEEVIRAAKMADADGFIRELPEGYDTDVGPRGVRLSGGQRQRVAIARAFLRDAPILILDEATSALDGESERAVHGALERLRRGRTTLMIAHRLSTIKDADRIVVIKDGAVAEEGTYSSLMQKGGEFAKLYQE